MPIRQPCQNSLIKQGLVGQLHFNMFVCCCFSSETGRKTNSNPPSFTKVFPSWLLHSNMVVLIFSPLFPVKYVDNYGLKYPPMPRSLLWGARAIICTPWVEENLWGDGVSAKSMIYFLCFYILVVSLSPFYFSPMSSLAYVSKHLLNESLQLMWPDLWLFPRTLWDMQIYQNTALRISH